MKYILYLTTLVFSFISCSTAVQKGTQQVLPKGTSISISGFTRISSSVGANIHIEVNPDSPYRCMLACEKSIEAKISFDIVNDELQISAKEDFSTTQPIQIDMRVQDLKAMSNNGSGMITIDGEILGDLLTVKNTGSGSMAIRQVQTNKLNLLSTGSGDIMLSGKTKALTVKINGSGNVKAYTLDSENAVSAVTGSGNIELSVSAELEANIVGTGNIYYKGNPNIRNNITGSGLLTAR